MTKWIEEFKSYVNDQSIVDYYQNEIEEMKLKNYFDICEQIGKPSDIAREEMKNTKKIDLRLLISRENLSTTLFMIFPLLIIFFMAFISSLMLISSDLKSIRTYITIKDEVFLNKSIMITANILLGFSISYIIYSFIERTIFKINDIVYKYNRVLMTISMTLLSISIIFIFIFGLSNEKFDQEHLIKEFKHKVIKKEK